MPGASLVTELGALCTDGEISAQRGKWLCPWSHSTARQLGPSPRPPASIPFHASTAAAARLLGQVGREAARVWQGWDSQTKPAR